jgi:hypothetical protein
MPLAYIHELTGSHPDQGLPGGRPPHVSGGPIIPPPLPGVWPPEATPTPPIFIPPAGEVSNPIVIPGTPTHPITLPPGVYPPLPPTGAQDKYAILVLVVGVGWRWVVVDPGASVGTPLPTPPSPSPK